MAALFSPYGNSQFLDASGNPAVGYKIFTYLAGSSTPVAAYTDSAGLTAQTNPIILDSLGQVTNGQLWLAVGVTYKFVVQDAFGAMVDTVDNITGVASASAAIGQFQPSGVTPTFVSANSFTLAGDQTTEFHVGRRVLATTTGGAVYGTIISSAYTSLTTVTLVTDGVALDSGLSAVSLSILRADRTALPQLISTDNRNRIINGAFQVNQRGVTGTVTLAAGIYGHDRWKAGAAGCTYTFATSGIDTTITITAGSLQQVIEDKNIEGGQYIMSWSGTAQGKVGAGSYAASGLVSGAQTANTNLTVEFGLGTLTRVQLEPGNNATPFERKLYDQILRECQRYYETGVMGFTGANYFAGPSNFNQRVPFKVTKRVAPTLTYGSTAVTNASSYDARDPTVDSFRWFLITTGQGAYGFEGPWTASAEI